MKINKIATIIIMAALSLLCATTLQAARDHQEKWYQDNWCNGKGQSEVILSDNTRCDCLTSTHAIEFDFGSKWAEAIGQSLHYASRTGKRAGIVLILEQNSDLKYFVRLNETINRFKLPIDVWLIDDDIINY